MNDCPIAAAARRNGGKPALAWSGGTLTYAQLDSEVAREVLELRAPVRTEVRRAFPAPTSVETIIRFHALGRMGEAFLPVNPKLTDAELRRYMRSAASGPKGRGIRIALFTSGTTGNPRLVEISESNLAASAAASGALLGDDADQRWLLALPLFHIGGLALVDRCARYGACVEIHEKFDAERVAASLRHRVTYASLVPTMLERILALPDSRPFAGLRAVLVGGGPATKKTLRIARERGLPVLQSYGMTETTSQVATERIGEADGTTCGPPLPGVQIKIVDAGGKDTAKEGAIHVNGPTVTTGDWLATGDIGSLDGRGRLTLFARRLDLILRGGENISPLEVEAALRECPGVVDAVVLPLRDDAWGQVPHAYVVLDKPLAMQRLEGLLEDRLARFKIPRVWTILPKLPRNAVGKVDRMALRELKPQLTAPREKG